MASLRSTFRTDPRNANLGTERGRTLLVQSLREAGAGRSILVDKHGQIICGNKTFDAWAGLADGAALEVVHTDGTKMVVVQRDDLDLDDPQGLARKLAYYDNRTSELDLAWDVDRIVQDVQAGLDLSALWTPEELETLLAEVQSPAGPSDIVEVEPEIDRAEALREQYGVELGQLWQCGRHRVLCGDCLSPLQVDRLLDGAVPGMLYADPPYGVSIVATNVPVGGGEAYAIPFGGVTHRRHSPVGGGQRQTDLTGHSPIETWGKDRGSDGAAKPFGSKKVRGTVGASHVVPVGKYAPIVGDDSTATALAAVTTFLQFYPAAIHVWWGGNYYADHLPASSCWLVWDKETTGHFADCELAWTNQPRAARLFHHRWNGMLRDSERERRWHPTQKPVALAAWVFETLGAPDDVVLDPFVGCGPSLVAAEQTQRTLYALELSPDYVAVSLHRWATLTGQPPQLLATAVGAVLPSEAETFGGLRQE